MTTRGIPDAVPLAVAVAQKLRKVRVLEGRLAAARLDLQIAERDFYRVAYECTLNVGEVPLLPEDG